MLPFFFACFLGSNLHVYTLKELLLWIVIWFAFGQSKGFCLDFCFLICSHCFPDDFKSFIFCYCCCVFFDVFKAWTNKWIEYWKDFTRFCMRHISDYVFQTRFILSAMTFTHLGMIISIKKCWHLLKCNFNLLVLLYTFVRLQLLVKQHMPKKLWKFELNWS